MNPSQEPASTGGAFGEPAGPDRGPGAEDQVGAPARTGAEATAEAHGGLGADGLDGPWGLPYAPWQPRRRPWRRTLAVAALTVLAVVAAGVPLGLLWAWLAPDVPVIETPQGQVVVNDPSPEEFIAADGWFTLLGFGFGVLVAIAAWLILRRHRGPWLLLSVVVGTLGASMAAWQVGRMIGLGDYEDWRAVATAGATYSRPPDLHAHGALLVPAFAAVIVCTLLAGWSNDPELDTPGAQPGYDHDFPAGPLGYDGYELSSGSSDGPDPTAEPAPPAPGTAAPPRG